MNKLLLLGVAATAFLAGFLLGRRGPPTPAPERAAKASRVPIQESTVLREEVVRLQRRVRELESTSEAPVPADRSPEADALMRELRDPRLAEDPKRWLRATGRLADLDPSMAPLFVRRYREKAPPGDALALELALACGGPEVVGLLKDIFGGAATPPAQRHLAGICLSGSGLVAQMWPAYAPDPALAELAGRYAGSAEPLDRRAAIGLWRLQPGDAARAQLTFFANDPDATTQAAAVRALGTVGDRSTLLFLTSHAAKVSPRLFEDDEDVERTPLEHALLQAVDTLRRRYPD